MASGRAEVGQTEMRIEARLGKSVDAAGRERLYRQGGDFYLVTYQQGFSAAEYRFARLTVEQHKGLRVPAPPYPAQTHPNGEGIGLYEVSFDASGTPSNVRVVQSATSLLDHYTDHYARERWRGPPASAVTLAVAYHETGERPASVHCGR